MGVRDKHLEADDHVRGSFLNLGHQFSHVEQLWQLLHHVVHNCPDFVFPARCLSVVAPSIAGLQLKHHLDIIRSNIIALFSLANSRLALGSPDCLVVCMGKS